MAETILIVHNPDTFASSISEILDIPPETNWTIGTYFIYSPSDSLWVSKLNLPETAVRLDPKYLPNGLPYTEPSLFNITWDGDKTDKQVIGISEEGETLVKISDEIPSDITTDFLGSQLTVTENGEVVETIQIDSSYIDPIPGAIAITGMVYIIYDSDTLLANTPEEYRFDFTNGVYFMYVTDSTDETYSAYVSSLVGASVIHKLDSKYLPDDINVTPESLGLATVATTGNYNDLINQPTIPTVDQTYQPTSSDAQSGKAVAEAVAEVNIRKTVSGFCPELSDIGTTANAEITTISEQSETVYVYDHYAAVSIKSFSESNTMSFTYYGSSTPNTKFKVWLSKLSGNDMAETKLETTFYQGSSGAYISTTLTHDITAIRYPGIQAGYTSISLKKGTKVNIFISGDIEKRSGSGNYRLTIHNVCITTENPQRTISASDGIIPVSRLFLPYSWLVSTSDIVAKYIPNEVFANATEFNNYETKEGAEKKLNEAKEYTEECVDNALTLTFKDTNNGLPTPIAKLDNNSEPITLGWDGTIATSLSSTAAGTEDDPIIINNANELAYLVNRATDTAGKYYKIADNIESIVLQSTLIANSIKELNNWEDVKSSLTANSSGNIFDSSKRYTWVSNANAFNGHFDGNGVTIYGLYAEGSYCGLFGVVGDGATIKNVIVKNSYLRPSWYAGVIVSNSTDVALKIENCIIANCAIYAIQAVTSIPNQCIGLAVGRTATLQMNNCFIYGCDLSYETDSSTHNYIVGGASNSITKTKSILLDCISNPYHYTNIIDNIVYTNNDIVSIEDIKGEKAVTAMPNLAWGIDWFIPDTYTGKATPLEFTQFSQNALLNLIQSNADIVNDKKITSLQTTEKYTFDWNAMYLIKSNSGNEDITLYNSATNTVVVDGDGNNLPASSICILVMPKESMGVGTNNKLCFFLGQTGEFSVLKPNVFKGVQFTVTNGDVYFTPAVSASVFKIAL